MNAYKLITLTILILSNLGSPVQPKLDHFIFHDGYFYAVAKNRYQIVKLDQQGHQVASIGRRGRGPAEFSAPDLNLTFGGDTLYVYDGINKRLTLLDEDLNNISERYPKELIGHIAYYRATPYSISIDFKRSADEAHNERSLKSFLKMEKNSDFVIRSINDKQKVLATFHNKVVTPLYSSIDVKSNGRTIVIYHAHQNNMLIYHDGVLKKIKLPSMESFSLGRKMDLNHQVMKKLYKAYPYIPVYSLVKNVVFAGDDKMIIQSRSYKRGDQLLFYDLNSYRLIHEVSSPQGRLVGRDADTLFFYLYEDGQIRKYSLKSLKKCPDRHLTFYIGAFREQCALCKQSFFKIYDWLRGHNIPYNFVVKDNHWFGSVDEDDYRSVIDYMHQWNVWGAISFEDNCPACFKNGMHIKFDNGKLQSLPMPVADVKSAFSCTDN